MSTRDLRIGDVLPDDMARQQDLEATRDALEEALAEVRRVTESAEVAYERLESERDEAEAERDVALGNNKALAAQVITALDALSVANEDVTELRASYVTAVEERAEARTQLAYWRNKSAQQGAELDQLREAYAALLASRPSELETLLRASLEPTRMAMGNVSRSPVRAAGEAMATFETAANTDGRTE